MSHRVAPERVQSLDVKLSGTFVGTLVRTPGGYHAFDIAPSYRTLDHRPTLSQSLLSANGSLLKDFKPTAVHLPPLFANMLPEGKLREALEKHHRPDNDFDLMVALGSDLPGAVVLTPTDGTDNERSPSKAKEPGRARFSLAGVQMKLSVFKNKGKGSGLTVALDDHNGNYIAKFPSMNFPALAENEHAMLALAAAVGMDVPNHELVSQAEFEGIPEEFAGLAQGKVLIVERFDRGLDQKRIHVEDFAQVLRVYPHKKYDAASSQNVAMIFAQAVSSEAAIEFVRRLTFSVLIGNGDMHLKNWSLIYPSDGVKPAIAPVCDFVSTIPYLPNDGMALTIAGEKAFDLMTPDHWRRFARKAHLPEGAVVDAVGEVAERVWEAWKTLPEKDAMPEPLVVRIDAHMEKQMAVLEKKDLTVSEHPSLPTP
jgi:serine/threonine-protein kinase HipA